MQTKDFDYHLPAERIAQRPMSPRDHSRLMVMDRASGNITHKHFFDLPELLQPGDVLVMNNSKVIKARLTATKDTGGKLEVFLLRPLSDARWEVLIGGRGAAPGKTLTLESGVTCRVLEQQNDTWIVEFNKADDEFDRVIAEIGDIPLPPYIKERANDAEYQTVYAKHKGSVAAPTAGLHFTDELLSKLRAKGVQVEFITLHVGLGTFKPVTATRVEDHNIHTELAEVSPATAERLNNAKREGRRVIAVGTTSVRTLEGFANERGELQHGTRDLDIYIYPGYTFRFTDAMITNFHLPKSSLLMLVSAFSSRERILNAYDQAIQHQYRFYSFGDAMLLA